MGKYIIGFGALLFFTALASNSKRETIRDIKQVPETPKGQMDHESIPVEFNSVPALKQGSGFVPAFI